MADLTPDPQPTDSDETGTFALHGAAGPSTDALDWLDGPWHD